MLSLSFIDTQIPSAVKSGKWIHGKRKTVEGRASGFPPTSCHYFFFRGYMRDSTVTWFFSREKAVLKKVYSGKGWLKKLVEIEAPIEGLLPNPNPSLNELLDQHLVHKSHRSRVKNTCTQQVSIVFLNRFGTFTMVKNYLELTLQKLDKKRMLLFCCRTGFFKISHKQTKMHSVHWLWTKVFVILVSLNYKTLEASFKG